MVDLNKLVAGRNLNDIERTLLYYIVEHIDDVLKMGVRGIAKNNYISTSTIMRLTKKLGYDGFVDMYYKLVPMIKNNAVNNKDNSRFLDSFNSNSILKYNTYDQMKEFAKELYKKKDKFIFIYATGFSSILAEYLSKKLLVLGIKCIFSNGMDSIGVFENNLVDMDMLIIVSKSGETRKVLERARTAKENGIFVVSFTGESDNQICNCADIRFRIEDSNKLDDRNMMANTFFPNVMLLMELLIYEYNKYMSITNYNLTL